MTSPDRSTSWMCNRIMRSIATRATWRLSAAWNRFKVQFRYDEIPHTYTNTARTLYTETGGRARRGQFSPSRCSPGTLCRVWPRLLRCPAPSRPSWCPSMNFIVPAIERRAGTILFAYDLTPDWDLLASYSREHESGTRPLGLIFNSSPSASLTGGFGAEVPEPIDYFNNTVKVRAEYVRKRLAIQIGYTGSFFQNDTKCAVFRQSVPHHRLRRAQRLHGRDARPGRGPGGSLP